MPVAVAELSGVSVVGLGSFNPAIIHPLWLADKKLISENAAEHALQSTAEQQVIITPQVAVFVADWLRVQVTQQQAVFSTVDMGRELDLRDFVRSVFELLPETPVTAIGINADTHFRVESETAWHAFGDRFLPKDFWEPLFAEGAWKKRPNGQVVGMRVMTVEVVREQDDFPGWVRVEVAPSVRVLPYGVYTGINAHYELSAREKRPTAYDAARILREKWDATRALEAKLIASLSKEV